MKIISSLFLLFLITSVAYAQNTTQKLGITYSFANNDILIKSGLIGGPGHEGEGSFSFGIQYEKRLKGNLWFETGLDYSKDKIKITSAPSPEPPSIYHTHTQLLTIPAYAKFIFAKYLFVNGGALFDFEVSGTNSRIDDQSGIGLGFGLGARYQIKHLEFFVNPFLKFHSVLAFQHENYQEHLTEDGWKFGISYVF